jgi:hypothetical protein
VSSSSRRVLTSILAVLSAIVLLGALVSGYATLALFDSDQFSERATAALDDEAVKDEIGRLVTENLVLNAQADLVAAQPVIEGVVSGIVGGSVFQSLFETGVRDVHRAVFQQDLNTATLTLADIGTVLRGALQALQPKLAKQIGANADVEVTAVEPPTWVTEIAQAAEGIAVLSLILLVAGICLAAAAGWLSRERRRTVLNLGVAIAIAGVATIAALGVGRALLLARVEDPGVREAADAVWGVFFDDLRMALFLFAACGAVVAAAASSLLAPVDLRSRLEHYRDRIAQVPERGWLRALRALALIVVGLVVIASREQVIGLVVTFAGLLIAYAGVAELMRMTMSAGPEHEAQERYGRRTLIATGVVAGAIFLAGAGFVALGGTREESLEIETVGCNGSEALCDRPLDQTAFAATHNAMSATSNEGFLFGMQEAGFADQLRDGVRALLIDAHYGQPTESGEIKTDLSDLTGAERKTYEQELGTDGLEAALRIRDRVVNSPTTGERDVYLCHRFCELGAVPVLDAFRTYRDFLAANPDEVLVIVIEDYVAPEDIEKAVVKSGLIDYVHKGAVGPPWPTLQEMIDSGGRALIMAEKDAGGGEIPWYHEVYDELVQETPFRFRNPEALTDRAGLAASCEPNRGPDDATMCLINHWVDTSPAPRPSNARKVNAEEVLLKRIRRCERIRGLPAGLIAVDFYREGDVFEVVEQLNAERASEGS